MLTAPVKLQCGGRMFRDAVARLMLVCFDRIVVYKSVAEPYCKLPKVCTRRPGQNYTDDPVTF